MIIVEGPDGAGKTTLVNLLVGEMNWPVAPKVVNSETVAEVDLVKWVEENLATGLTRKIFDRHRLISEPIYGPLLRGEMEPGFDNLKWLRSMQWKFEGLAPLVVFCLPPVDRVIANVVDDPNNKVVADEIQTIYWLYFNAASKWATGLVWDYTKPETMPRMIADIKGWAHMRELYP